MTILANGLNSDYITGPDLSPYLADKSTGQPLAGGTVWFYEDANRTTPKNVWMLTGSDSAGYSYEEFPNPITLSPTGTIDYNNASMALYYYPFDEFGNLQLYYIAVYDSNGLLQFTRQAWPYPNVAEEDSTIVNDAIGLTNMLTNPQFAVVNFNAGSTITVSYTGTGSNSIQIAPGWTLNYSYIGATDSSFSIAQTPVQGRSAYPFNPPFVLTITPGANMSGITLTQVLNNNPNWAASSFVSGSIMLGPDTSVTMNYVPSSGSPTVIIPLTNNTSGGRKQFNATVALPAPTSADTGLNGFDTIQLVLSSTVASEISNVQIIPLSTNVAVTGFDQTPINRQIDQMFNYYQAGLNFKPIPSYLVGWDFANAPFQPLGNSGGPFATGANSAVYINDTTIVFQTVDSSFAFSQGQSGALRLTVQAAPAQLAIVQYIPALTANALLFEKICAMVESVTDQTNGYGATVSIWATPNGSLPSCIGSNQTFFTGLDTNGYPTGAISGWSEIPQFYSGGTGLAKFTVGNITFGYASFNGWADFNSIGNTATFLAIVVGTASIPAHKNWSIQSVSLQAGTVPTIPAAESLGETLAKCQQFYQKSFPPGKAPAFLLGAAGCTLGAIEYCAQNSAVFPYGVPIVFPETMINTPIAEFYSLKSSNGTWTNLQSGAAINYTDSGVATVTAVSGAGTSTLAPNGMTIFNPQISSDVGGATMAIHYTLDARLGQ